MKLSILEGAILVEEATAQELSNVERIIDMLLGGQFRVEVSGSLWLWSGDPDEPPRQVEFHRHPTAGRVVGETGISEILLRWSDTLWRACPVPIGSIKQMGMKWVWPRVWFCQEQGDGSPTWEQDLLNFLRKPLLPDVELTPKVVARERFLTEYADELKHIWKQAGILS